MINQERSNIDNVQPKVSIPRGKNIGRSARAPDSAPTSPIIEAVDLSESRNGQHPQPHSFGWDLKYLLQNFRTALPLAVSDQLVLLTTLLLSVWGLQLFGASLETSVWALGLSLGCGLFFSFLIGELYPGVGLPPHAELHQCTVSTSLTFAVFLAATWLYAPNIESTVVVIAAWLISLVLIPMCRNWTRRLFSNFRWWLQPVLVFGHGRESKSLLKTLCGNRHLGLSPIGTMDDMHSYWNEEGNGQATFLGHPDEAPEVSRRHGVYRAIVAMPDRSSSRVQDILATSSDWFPHLLVIQKKQGLPLLWTKGWDYGWHSGIQVTSRLLLPLPRLTKRAVDLTLAGVSLLVLAPLMLLIIVAIKCTSAGPVFFGQERIGRYGRPFQMWKFRTMVVGAEQLLSDYLKRHPELQEEWDRDCKLKNDPRIIPWIGKLLRRTSLDELPQLWNVLMGQMSLVGPRPLPQYHLEEFNEDFRRYREKITPGMTGLWQISGRGNRGDDQMFIKWDRFYIRNWSLWLDLQILVRTPKTVFKGKGAY